ncbi:transmembrane and immunoglobulin domain-containing protein 1 isoform B [Patagioenas fasciata monilis]|nr:transmembrane and immunoglobulin domain-containing protein 1 isoform B [Patagioenas fasciata monilis]
MGNIDKRLIALDYKSNLINKEGKELRISQQKQPLQRLFPRRQLGSSEMAQSSSLAVLAVGFLAHVATAPTKNQHIKLWAQNQRARLCCNGDLQREGLELSVNDQTADFSLTTSLDYSISLSCLVQNSSQDEELLWYRGDGQVNLTDENKVNISNVCISPVTVSDNGVTFTCRLARDESVQVSVTLDVQFRPQLSGEESLQVEEDKDVTLSCNAKSNPQAQATWYKNNTILTLEESRYEVYHTSEVFQLQITTAQKSDNGTYSCVLQSLWGEDRKDFHLTVEDKKSVFPTEAVIAAVVVVALTILFGIVARRDKICKCFKRSSETAL